MILGRPKHVKRMNIKSINIAEEK